MDIGTDMKADILIIGGGAIGAAVAYFLKRMDGRAVPARNSATQQRHGCNVLRLEPDELKQQFPSMHVADVGAGGPANFHMLPGFSGHGLMHAPGCGRAMTELLLTDHRLDALRLVARCGRGATA